MNVPERAEDLLPAYVAGELAERERARVEAALARSPRLRAELARYERLFALLAAARAQAAAAPPGLEARVVRRVAAGWHLRAAVALVEDLLGLYGRALVDYLGLGREGVA